MSEPFLAEIKLVSFAHAPKGWALCNGQFMLINQNQALFSLLGTAYGGNGQTTFALPNLRGRVPIHMKNTFEIGTTGGSSTVTVSIQELPTHTHVLQGSSLIGNNVNPLTISGGNVLAQTPGSPYTNSASNLTTLNPASVTSLGGSQPHTNMQPYLVLNFIIALQGIFPSRN